MVECNSVENAYTVIHFAKGWYINYTGLMQKT